MPDDELRELERRWRATGAVEDEARWLLARVRAGELSVERLSAAAMLGHAAALATGAAVEVQGGGPLQQRRRIVGQAPITDDLFRERVELALAPLSLRDQLDIGCEAVERALMVGRNHDASDAAPERAIELVRAFAEGQATPEQLEDARADCFASTMRAVVRRDHKAASVGDAAAFLARLDGESLPSRSVALCFGSAKLAAADPHAETAWFTARIVSQLLRGQGHGHGHGQGGPPPLDPFVPRAESDALPREPRPCVSRPRRMSTRSRPRSGSMRSRT